MGFGILKDFIQKPACETQSFYCTHPDGKRLYAELYAPQNKEGVLPLVILGHGYTGSYCLLKGYAEYLAGHGIICCIFDFCGGSNYSRSDGSMLDMSVITQVADMKLLISEIKKRTVFDTGRLFIGGESQGGLVAALAAAELQDEIAGLILLYPALYIPEIMRRQFPDRSAIPARMVQVGTMVGGRYAEDVYGLDAYGQITKYTGNVLIFHGTQDGMVPLRYSQRARQEYQNARLVVLEGAGHGIYSGKAMETICKEIKDFIEQERDE